MLLSYLPSLVLGVSITITSPKTGDIVRLDKSIDPMEPDAATNIFPLKFESKRYRVFSMLTIGTFTHPGTVVRLVHGEFRIPQDGYIRVRDFLSVFFLFCFVNISIFI